MPAAKRRFMNVFLLALLNLSIMASLRNLPLVAEYGLSALFFYLVVAFVFLLPSALVSAELATGWTRTGGVYIWVREALGARWGFFAIWMQWIHNVTWFPAILSFAATTTAYAFSPQLATNKFYIVGFVLVGFWSMTFMNYYGLKTSSLFSAVSVVLGTIIPGLLIIAFGVHWVISGSPLHIAFSWDDLLPKTDRLEGLVFLAGLFLAFGGLEVSAVHAREVKNPQKNYPIAILLAGAMAFIVLSLGSLSISIVIPKEDISLVAGLMSAFSLFLSYYKIHILLIPLALMIVIGAVGELNAWIIGPVRGLYATSKHGDLPPIFQKTNPKGVPMNLLFLQAIIVTIVTFVFLILPSASSAFWILSAMSAQLYLLMYILMFISAIRLRYSHPYIDRSYRIPHKHAGMWFVAGIGILSSTFGFVISFFPPSQFDVGSILFYESFLILGVIIMCAIPLLIYQFRKPTWHINSNKRLEERQNSDSSSKS